jgi:hypothetical protein
VLTLIAQDQALIYQKEPSSSLAQSFQSAIANNANDILRQFYASEGNTAL